TDQRIDLCVKFGLCKFLRKSPQLASAGDRRMVVEEHAVRVATLAAFERNRDDLAALGVVAETSRVRHANEFVLHQWRIDLQRLWHELAQLLWVRAIGDD